MTFAGEERERPFLHSSAAHSNQGKTATAGGTKKRSGGLNSIKTRTSTTTQKRAREEEEEEGSLPQQTLFQLFSCSRMDGEYYVCGWRMEESGWIMWLDKHESLLLQPPRRWSLIIMGKIGVEEMLPKAYQYPVYLSYFTISLGNLSQAAEVTLGPTWICFRRSTSGFCNCQCFPRHWNKDNFLRLLLVSFY